MGSTLAWLLYGKISMASASSTKLFDCGMVKKVALTEQERRHLLRCRLSCYLRLTKSPKQSPSVCFGSILRADFGCIFDPSCPLGEPESPPARRVASRLCRGWVDPDTAVNF
jgi:hypothetical protein